jgi:hypothetical protein
MKAKCIVWSALALASALCGLGLWRSRTHQTGLATAQNETPPQTLVQAPQGTPNAQHSGQEQVTVYQHPEEAPPWAVIYGHEFWRRPLPATQGKARPGTPGTHPAINLGGVVDRVSHAFRTDAANTPPRVQAKNYVATLQADSLRFSPAGLPQRTEGEPPAGGSAPGQMTAEEKRLSPLADRTPETPEEEDLLMTRLSELAAADAHAASGTSSRGDAQGAGAARRTSAWSPQPDPQTEAAFQTASVELGSRVLYRAPDSSLSWAVLGNTAQALLDADSGLIEHFEAGSEGVAVTWVLTRQPQAVAPLTIEAQITGLTYAGQTSGGHHFADRTGTARLRVGNATIADAAGRQWEVPTQFRAGALAVTVPGSILAEAVYPVAIDPLISPEFGMDTPIVVPAPAAQQNPAVAANSGNFFVAWEDQRSSGGSGASIYGTRVTGAGVVSDPNGIALSPVGASAPAVAPNGSGYLVVWTDGRNVATTGLDIYGARVSGAGQVLDAGGFPISKATGDQFSPAAIANGTDSFVVWQDGRSVDTGPDIYGARVTSAGVVSDASGIPISTAVGAQASPAIGFNGAHFLVVWTDQRGGGDFYIYGARVTPAGAVLDTSGVPISTVSGGEFFPKAAASGTNFFVVWEDYRNVGAGFVDIYGARVNDAGTVLDRGGFPIGTGSGDRHTPAVASAVPALSDYLVVWQDSRNLGTSGLDIYGARVTAAGAVTDPAGFPISTAPDDQSTPVLAFDGSQYLVVWTDARNLATTDLDIYGTFVTTGAVVSPPAGFVISTGSSGEQQPATASNGTNYLVVWQDYRNGATTGADLYGVRVSTGGVVLDLSALPISTAASDQISPAVASDGTDYLVVWEDHRNDATTGADIYGARITEDGTVQDANGIPISTASSDQLAPAVSGSGGAYLVVWQDGRNLANSGTDIYGSRVSRAGAVLDAGGIAICTANAAQYSAAVAFNGTHFLVVWSDERNLGVTGVDIYGTRVGTAGAVLDSPNLAISQAPGDAVFPAVGSAGGDFLVVWEDGRNSATTGDDIYGARVINGVVSDPSGLAIAVAPNYQAVPAVAASGTNYLVVWQDGRNSSTTGADLYGARVGTTGVVLDAGGIPINTGPFDQQSPKLASGSPDVFLVVGQSLERGSTRTVGNFVYLDDFPVITRVTVAGGSATLTWLSIPNRAYRVEFKANLAAAVWSNLVPDIIASGTVSTQVDNTIGTNQARYYRVMLLPQ